MRKRYPRSSEDTNYVPTQTGAKRLANKTYNPSVVFHPRYGYDWLPHGHPLIPGEVVVSDFIGKRWRDVSPESLREFYGPIPYPEHDESGRYADDEAFAALHDDEVNALFGR